MSRLLAIALVLHVGLYACQRTDTDQEADAPIEAQQTFDELRALADEGDALAQFNLGVRYANGEGVPQDDVEAVRWYRLAADQGHAEAQFNLGAMYDDGRGVPEDDAEAVRWYRLAADQGLGTAQYNLGTMYTEGLAARGESPATHRDR